jgi:CheY-like chemotaxis protein
MLAVLRWYSAELVPVAPTVTFGYTNVDALRKHVLVVEDDPAIGPLMVDILAEAGFEVTLATNGPDALKMAAELRPDVITLDLMLPGMSGEQVIQALRADPATRSIPVVIVSAYGPGFPSALAAADAYIPKPFDVDDLIEVVESLALRTQSMSSRPS